jgi:RHH-type proline utilization regulon transcriptional repressor/proline dehydrogenase/delta 1-pyrroline-5-carboxylate dehydrogenase
VLFLLITIETQPFGGKNLSGSGFKKAGGPNYLLQFMDERVITINTVAIGGNIDLINLLNDEG